MKYLTVPNVLADNIYLLDVVKHERGLKKSSVIAIGQSYSGELATWLRMKYP